MTRSCIFKSLALGACMLALPAMAQAEPPQDWDVTIGAGAGIVPEYEGSDNYEVVPVPVVEAEYQEGLFFLSGRRGIGSYPIRTDDYKIGGSIGYDFGRDESDDRENLTGMGDVDGSVTANLMADHTILGVANIAGGVTTALTGDYGTTADIRLGSRYPVNDRVSLTGSVGTTLADDEHMQHFFGVSPSQSAASGYAAHDAGAGFKSVGVSIGANYAIDDRWNVNATIKGDQLLGDAADSPVVKDEFQSSGFVTTSYRF